MIVRRQPLLVVSLVVLGLLYSGALFAEFLAPYSPERQFREQPLQPPAIGGDLQIFVRGEAYTWLGIFSCDWHLFGSESPVFILGSDAYGRDIFSRLLFGSRISLTVGLLGVIVLFALGLLMGGISGYFGGVVDSLIMRFCEILMSFPGLYFILALRAMFPLKMSSIQIYFMIVVVMSIVGWASLARVIRGLVLSLKEEPFVKGAQVLGASHARVIIRHILPHTFSYTIVALTLSIPGYILGESALSLLGLGIQEPQASWGNMLTVARSVRAVSAAPWLLLPGFCILLTVLAFNFLGDALRDLLDPYDKGVRI